MSFLSLVTTEGWSGTAEATDNPSLSATRSLRVSSHVLKRVLNFVPSVFVGSCILLVHDSPRR
jgi:hypothetical protein